MKRARELGIGPLVDEQGQLVTPARPLTARDRSPVVAGRRATERPPVDGPDLRRRKRKGAREMRAGGSHLPDTGSGFLGTQGNRWNDE